MVHEFAGPAYATSKAALKSLTREMASDLSKYNIGLMLLLLEKLKQV